MLRQARYLTHSSLDFLSPFRYEVRCYARGTRLFDSQDIPSQQPRHENNSKNSEVSNEPAKQLLENATLSERFRGTGFSTKYEAKAMNGNIRRNQATHSYRPEIDPSETSIILFPGQGTQFIGMGRDLLNYPMVKDMYELASSILGYNLLSLCLDGPKKTLDQTLFCQPAILVASLASLQKLKALNPQAVENCVATAGFSVGELAALVFSKALTFENAVKLVKIRAEAMQLASEATPSGMMTVFYGPDSSLKKACEQARLHCQSLGIENVDCAIANYLYPDCKVIAGNLEALDYVSKHAANFKLKKLKRIPVSGAFHTRLMEPASGILKKALKTIPISQPTIPVHSNIDGKRYKNVDHISKLLPRQVTSPVYWEQTMHILYERSKDQRFPKTYECGPGRSLKAILAKINARAAQHCTNIDV